jgi:hypothetical protein
VPVDLGAKVFDTLVDLVGVSHGGPLPEVSHKYI